MGVPGWVLGFLGGDWGLWADTGGPGWDHFGATPFPLFFPPSPNPDPPVVLPESRCTAGGGDGVRCVCSAAAVPEAAVVFELPSRNLTVAEGHRDFAAAPRGGPGTGGGPGGVVTGILTLRGALEPRLAVLCAARNPHGVTARQLRFHHPGQHRRDPPLMSLGPPLMTLGPPPMSLGPPRVTGTPPNVTRTPLCQRDPPKMSLGSPSNVTGTPQSPLTPKQMGP